MPPGTQSASFVIRFNPGTIPSMAERLMPAFKRHAIETLAEVCKSVIEACQEMLVELPPDHVPYDNVMGGRDTSKMANSLAYVLSDTAEQKVIYSLSSSEAVYWAWVNFGHFYYTKDGPKWWEGYHFFERAITAHEEAINAAARLAWHRAVVEVGPGHLPPLSGSIINSLSAHR